MKKNTAKDGVFNKEGKTPLESVEIENLHNVLYYLNIQAAETHEANEKV